MEAHNITLMNKTEDDELSAEELNEEELRQITGVCVCVCETLGLETARSPQ